MRNLPPFCSTKLYADALFLSHPRFSVTSGRRRRLLVLCLFRLLLVVVIIIQNLQSRYPFSKGSSAEDLGKKRRRNDRIRICVVSVLESVLVKIHRNCCGLCSTKLLLRKRTKRRAQHKDSAVLLCIYLQSYQEQGDDRILTKSKKG